MASTDSNVDLVVNHPNDVTVTSNESTKKSNSTNENNNTEQARKESTETNIDLLVNHPNEVILTNNQLTKESNSMNVPSTMIENTLVSTYSTLNYDGPSTSTGYYSTVHNVRFMAYRTNTASNGSSTDSD